jgi:uncharacterized protein
VRRAEISTGKSSARATGQWLLLAFLHLYRVFLSPFLGGACKFYPSCSQYAQEAIALHGAKHGSWLALKRLGRCRPFTKGGFDPVPDSLLGYERGMASGAKAPFSAMGTAGLKPRPSGSILETSGCGSDATTAGRREMGLVAASRDFHDYSDAEWLRSVNKELVQ